MKPTVTSYVTEFDVLSDYPDVYETHVVGGQQHVAYWIPAEELEHFNDAMVSRSGSSLDTSTDNVLSVDKTATTLPRVQSVQQARDFSPFLFCWHEQPEPGEC